MKCAGSPSFGDALLIESAGVSSSMIVVVTDVAAASSVARSGRDSETMKGSLTSSVVSWVAWTVNVLPPPLGTVSRVRRDRVVEPAVAGPLGARVELDRRVRVRAVGQADRVRRRRALVDRRRSRDRKLLRVVGAGLPGKSDQAAEEEPSGAKPANGCARHLKPPPSTSPWCTTITVRKKGWPENLPGRRGALMPSGVAADTATRRQLLFPPLVDPKERKTPAPPGSFV